MANLHHPHVAPITDAGALADGTPFVIMERMHGQTLDERLHHRGELDLVEVVPIVRGVASALVAAHAAGVIHRELRLHNVFMADDVVPDLAAHANGSPRVLDFGAWWLTAAARAAGRVVRPAAAAGEAAPEQWRDHGAGADHRADQFALAALAQRLMRGAAAPSGAAGGPAFQRLWDRPLRREGMPGPSTPAVDAVLARAMSWRPEGRFDSVASFLGAFEAALAASPSPSPSPAPSRAPAPSPSPLQPVRSAAPPASLTQQFFAEGDRQDAAAASPPAASDGNDPDSGYDSDSADGSRTMARSGTFERVPRRRAPLMAAAALGLAALAIIARSALLSSHGAPVPGTAPAPQASGVASQVLAPARSPSIVPLVASSRPAHPRAAVVAPTTMTPPPSSPPPAAVIVTPPPMPATAAAPNQAEPAEPAEPAQLATKSAPADETEEAAPAEEPAGPAQ